MTDDRWQKWSFAVLVAVLALPGLALAHHGDDNVSISVDEDTDHAIDCSEVRVEFHGEKALRAEERMEIPVAGTLQVDLDQRGGVRVHGSAGSTYSVRLCKAVSSGSASEILGRVRLSLDGSKLTVRGPAGSNNWVGYLLIDAPRGASLQIEASNAPISFHQVSGTFAATAVNGPISMKNSAGALDARTTNGPISFAGGEGDVKLTAVNGPVSVKLSGSEWRGRGLTAATTNGPMSVKLAEDYRSGVEITGSRGPFSCKGVVCPEVDRDDRGRTRTMTLGTGPPLVRLSTTNGPVSIKTN